MLFLNLVDFTEISIIHFQDKKLVQFYEHNIIIQITLWVLNLIPA